PKTPKPLRQVINQIFCDNFNNKFTSGIENYLKMVDTLIEQVKANVPAVVVVHPTVLLSIVDHYNRIAKDTKKRVVGVLMGEYGDKNVLDVTNCYAVPFEEDVQEPNVWFFDHIYHETMYNMMRKINSKEKVIG